MQEWMKRVEQNRKATQDTVAQPLHTGPPSQSSPCRKSLQTTSAPLAQLDRASGYEPGGRRFESCRAHQFSLRNLRSGVTGAS
jgi:hypothetical protein